ncbi:MULTISPECIES: hypothetical protein [unclassified Bartonella]|uniref:hypothetical protein n=1 Tax=unclassified Bartonella TaxID=2645622 RepID=UPI0035D0920C
MYIRKSEVEDLWIYALCVFWGHVGLLSGVECGEINGGGGICEWRGKLGGRGVLSALTGEECVGNILGWT